MSVESKIKNLAEDLSYQDRSAVAFGFPTELDSELYLQEGVEMEDSFDGEEDRTAVNGKWKPIRVNPEFDGFDFVDDDEFDNFLTKKSRARLKKKKELKRQYKSQGLSGRDARKKAKTDALKEIPRDKVKDVLKRGFQKIGNAIKVGALALPRASYLSLVAINFRGQAWKLAEIKDNPKNANKLKKVKEKWKKLGGQWSKLVKNIDKGKGKKVFFCGKKCKQGLADKNLKKSFTNFVEGNHDFYDADPVTISASTWVAIGSSVLGAMTSVIGAVAMKKTKEKEIQAQKEVAEKELATLSQAEKNRIALAEKNLQNQADPVRAIMNNPNLSAQEKQEAIKLTQSALDKGSKQKIIRYAIIGGLVLAGLFVASKILKNKNKK